MCFPWRLDVVVVNVAVARLLVKISEEWRRWHKARSQVAVDHHMNISHVLREMGGVGVTAYAALPLDLPI